MSFGFGGDGKRKRKTVYGVTKSEVLAKLEAAKADDKAGMSKPEKASVGQFLAHWLDAEVRPNLQPGTVKGYADAVRLHVAPHVGKLQLGKLTPEHVAGLYATLRKAGTGPRAVELVHVVLKRAMNVAVKWGRLRANPVAAVTRPKYERKEKPAVTTSQVQALLKVAEGDRLEALFVVAASTGLRQGELFALSWADVDLQAGTISVRHSLEELNGKLRVKEPKSKTGRRVVELPGVAVQALVSHKERMQEEGFSDPAGIVFCDADGGHLRKSNFIRNTFDPIRKAAKLPIVFHQLRHFHGTFLVEIGTDARTLQQRLGHADVATTLRFYVTPGRASDKKAADAFGAAFGKSAD